MKKNVKKLIFSVEGMRNVYWDESPIAVGCEVSIPFKFDGNQPLCIISHGSGGLGNDTEHFVNILSWMDDFRPRRLTIWANFDLGFESEVQNVPRLYPNPTF